MAHLTLQLSAPVVMPFPAPLRRFKSRNHRCLDRVRARGAVSAGWDRLGWDGLEVTETAWFSRLFASRASGKEGAIG